MSGRAGRLALVNDFGRSIMVTGSPFEADVWLRHYAGAEFEDVRPMLGDGPLEDHVLDVLTSGLASTRDEVEELLLSSFTGQVHWAQKISREELASSLTNAVDVCAAADLLRRVGDRVEIEDRRRGGPRRTGTNRLSSCPTSRCGSRTVESTQRGLAPSSGSSRGTGGGHQLGLRFRG
jgi:hypothetical protein